LEREFVSIDTALQLVQPEAKLLNFMSD